jgi:hypothetical protein
MKTLVDAACEKTDQGLEDFDGNTGDECGATATPRR